MAYIHQNMLYMPHCDKKGFLGRWLVGMSPWNQKYFVPGDIKPAFKTGMVYVMLLILLHNPLLLYTNLLQCHKAFPVINPLVSQKSPLWSAAACLSLMVTIVSLRTNFDKVKDRVSDGWLWSRKS